MRSQELLSLMPLCLLIRLRQQNFNGLLSSSKMASCACKYLRQEQKGLQSPVSLTSQSLRPHFDLLTLALSMWRNFLILLWYQTLLMRKATIFSLTPWLTTLWVWSRLQMGCKLWRFLTKILCMLKRLPAWTNRFAVVSKVLKNIWKLYLIITLHTHWTSITKWP